MIHRGKRKRHWKSIGACANGIRVAAIFVGSLFLIAALAAQEDISLGGSQSGADDRNLEPLPCGSIAANSRYISVDSWVYPAMMRLYAMGYLGTVYLGMRPWTRASVNRMLEGTSEQIRDALMYGDPTAGEAQDLYSAIGHETGRDSDSPCTSHKGEIAIESLYTLTRAISGSPLRDSFHLGSTIVNDYGRPFANGLSNYSGLSGFFSDGRVLLYVRGEFQGSPAATGYSSALAQTLSKIDIIPFIDPYSGLPYRQETIPMGPTNLAHQGRFLEAYISTHFLDHEMSFGKQDEWLGPALGGGMAYSNNAENLYSLRINRTLPLEIPLLSRITGPFRYEFLVGKLRGHTYMPNPTYLASPAPGVPNVSNPGDPWVHVEKFSFSPTRDIEVGFERTVIWGGKGHEPITLHTFLKSFFSTQPTGTAVKFSNRDPGARFSAFDFTYRIPFPRNWFTLYTDSESHDSPSPIVKPLHGAFRPGLYLSHFPGLPKLDLRFEAFNTDSSNAGSLGGHYQYWEGVQVQGYTNNGQLFGDWAGREGKGGQAWLTYHLSGNEWLQAGLRQQKVSKDFIPGGTTLSDVDFELLKRLNHNLELKADFVFERYKAPIYLPGTQVVTATTVQLTWYSGRGVNF